ncbi:MAG: glycine cleavage system protein GcvH [Proteobacteria bacterium]|mgnify:FL=1|jgi:glycine cleavage system H protein|nr:glycine cleavage system protein GcvH [Pseudomonadota bacterium]MDA0900185.1 glycine cleavage system protein GcvH [Pseudomonadota bacterium]MDA1056538.1 glycine cleavage system protein GcvH [Pseudomonadota bacterium]
MANIPENLKYLESHEWAKIEDDGTVTVGISDHAQELLGDIVFVELPQVGSSIEKQADVAVVESVKAASDVYSPVSGEIIATNENLENAPETVNSSPYDDGWFFKIKPTNIDEVSDLLDAEAYKQLSE